MNQSETHTIDVDFEALIPAGSEVVMEIHYDGQPLNSALWVGANGYNGDEAPSYIQAAGCGVMTPTEVGEIEGIQFSKFIMSIEGEDIFLGTTEVLNSSKVIVYPNPIKDTFSLKLDNSVKIDHMQLFDLIGKSLKIFGDRTTNLNISDLPKGVYLLKIKTLEGKTINKKLIKN